MVKKLKGHTFGDYLKKHGLMPQHMQGKEWEEEEIIREELAKQVNPLDAVYDDPDDELSFEIAVVNKQNKALIMAAKVKESNVTIG